MISYSSSGDLDWAETARYKSPEQNYTEAESKEKNMVYGTLCRSHSNYNLAFWPPQSRLQHVYYGQPYARVDFIRQSGTLDLSCHKAAFI